MKINCDNLKIKIEELEKSKSDYKKICISLKEVKFN